jgi:acyl-CoA synthetase (AMP-forming)/AMP-acid ligase II
MARRWTTRTVPAALVERYEREGWWTDDTLGAKVTAWLAEAPATAVHVHSRTNGWHGTYADIDREARQLVTLLVDHGVEPGAVVAFQLPNWRQAIVSFAALTMGGYVLVPIVHIYGRREVSFILDECGAEAYLSPAAYGHVDYTAIVGHHAPSQLRVHIVVGDGAGTPPPAGIRRVGWDELARLAPAGEPASVDARDIAVLAYTSGTTSDPKGVIHDHRTLLSELRHMNGWINPGQSNLMGSPVTHATGMLGAVLGPLSCASAVHVIDRWDPGHALEVMRDFGIGGGTGAAIFLASLLDHPDFTAEHAANMRRIGLGGAPVPVALGRRAEALGIKIIRAYGSTEHPSTTGSQFDDPPDRRHATDGPPMPGVEVRVVDLDGTDVGPGQPGEVVSRGPDLCLGYTDPALNHAFDDEGWYHTGDIGILDDAGCLTITDRLKDIIIRGGENLSAAEIENAVMTVPAVAEVAVVAAPDDRLGEHACAMVRLQPGATGLTLAELSVHLEAAGIARQKWPEELRILTDFPRTASGKVRKVDLRAQLRAESGS